MHNLSRLLMENEDWLMSRVLHYAKLHDFTRYTSTLQEAWRLSISGLTASLCKRIEDSGEVPELDPVDDYSNDPLAQFGLVEAQRHRKRGTTLAMFLGLMKYYRQSYVDLLAEFQLSNGNAARDRLLIDRSFDRIEVAFCNEWVNTNPDSSVKELQDANRYMTNEKNTYLTVFESLSDPVLMLDKEDRLLNMNHAASVLIDPTHIPGVHYYRAGEKEIGPKDSRNPDVDQLCIGHTIAEVYPWLAPTLRLLREEQEESRECEAWIGGKSVSYEVKHSYMLDVSEKFTATVIILRDITKRTRAEKELRKTIAELGNALSLVKKLSGLLPICASCKKVRDDNGYWNQVEQYISDHTGATFSHAICPECVRKLYPEVADAILSYHEKGSHND